MFIVVQAVEWHRATLLWLLHRLAASWHCRASFFRSFELKPGADMTPHVAFTGPEEQDCAGSVDLSSALTGSNSTTLHHQVFPSHQDPMWTTTNPHSIYLFLAVPILDRLVPLVPFVPTHLRHCVDDDSIKTCSWSSALFSGRG